VAVMMQRFYWDCVVQEEKRDESWNYLTEEIPKLGKKGAGFDSIWLSPFSKAAEPNSNGYDPYDYFDLGDHDQKGSVKTAYGNSADLRKLISTLHEHGMGAIADMVINHNPGSG
jgi:alpha-amylase